MGVLRENKLTYFLGLCYKSASDGKQRRFPTVSRHYGKDNDVLRLLLWKEARGRFFLIMIRTLRITRVQMNRIAGKLLANQRAYKRCHAGTGITIAYWVPI